MALKVFGSSLASKVDNLYAPDPVASTKTYGPNQLGSNFPLASSFATILLIFSFKIRSLILNSLIFIFFPNALLSLTW